MLSLRRRLLQGVVAGAAGGRASAARTPSEPRRDGDDTFVYKEGDYSLVPRRYTVGKKIAVRSYLDRNRTELTDRTYMPQKAWFEAYDDVPSRFDRDYQRASYDFYNLETKLIWRAFDTPELIGMLLHDETLKGNRHMYDTPMLDAALHYTREARYWRCIGITRPFFNKDTLRVHCWEDKGTQVGTLVTSLAMRHALMDLERAVRRKELGLAPNYIWDRWGPIGFIDGAQADYLPRFEHNPYIDPDGVEVTELDVLPFNTHEQIKERFGEFIFPDTKPYEGVFAAIGHGSLSLEDVPNQEAVQLYTELRTRALSPPSTSAAQQSAKVAGKAIGALELDVPPSDLRTLFFLSTHPRCMALARQQSTWAEVVDALQPLQDECNDKIEAARMLENTRHEADRVRAFFEEKCGFHDFMYTPDKQITAAVLCYLDELHRLVTKTTWGAELARCGTDVERLKVMGYDSFAVYRAIEDAVLEKKRRLWATRFAGEANEESTLDYLLENFGRRMERPGSTVTVTGYEFDREQEPIGRQVQRRVLDADKAQRLAEVRRSKGRLWSNKRSVFDQLHRKQMQNITFGVH